MKWETLVPLIIEYGLPFAERVWQKWTSGADPSQADWDELKALAAQTPETQLLAAATRTGIDPSDPRIQALLAMLKPQPVSPPVDTPAQPS